MELSGTQEEPTLPHRFDRSLVWLEWSISQQSSRYRGREQFLYFGLHSSIHKQTVQRVASCTTPHYPILVTVPM